MGTTRTLVMTGALLVGALFYWTIAIGFGGLSLASLFGTPRMPPGQHTCTGSRFVGPHGAPAAMPHQDLDAVGHKGVVGAHATEPGAWVYGARVVDPAPMPAGTGGVTAQQVVDNDDGVVHVTIIEDT